MIDGNTFMIVNDILVIIGITLIVFSIGISYIEYRYNKSKDIKDIKNIKDINTK